MHNAAFDALGLDWRYVPLPVPPGQVEAAVRGLTALGFRGANVTVPHKQAVIPVLDSVASDASVFGAVNTLVVERTDTENPIISGCNTDHKGFISALRRDGFDPEGKCAVVVGAGGGGRAVVFGLLAAGAVDVLVLDLVSEKAKALVSNLDSDNSSRLHTLPLASEMLIESARKADLLVNATPVGMWPKIDDSIWPAEVPVPRHLAVFDLVYNPLETKLLQQVREAEAHPIGGLEMLVGQGGLSFERWTGRSAPIEVMRQACERALKAPDETRVR
jgi:shikimate dehydrogenase